MRVTRLLPLLLLPLAAALQEADRAGSPGWRKGEGWGWIWGEEDEHGALNHMSEATRLEALSLVREGKIYDLGVTFSRRSFVWPGHSASEVLTFRSPDGLRRQADQPFTLPDVNPARVGWHSCSLFVSDNVATQIDALGHIVGGDQTHAYNGIPLDDLAGDFGVRRLSAAGIPPIVNRAVLLDIAGLLELEALPSSFAITPEHIDAALERQDVEIRVGDIVLLRTGTLQYWGEDGAEHEKLAEHDSAGITLETARYLVEQKGALALGSDTSGLEVSPAPEGSDCFVPVHRYLLLQQGVHILEFHDLEELARDQAWEFCYVGTTNKIAGTTAGFALRPIAMR